MSSLEEMVAKEIDDNPWNALPWLIIQDLLGLHDECITEGNRLVPSCCTEDGEDYPCPTRQAISNRLLILWEEEH